MNDKPTKRETIFFLIAVVATLTLLLLLAVMQSLGMFGDMVLTFFGG